MIAFPDTLWTTRRRLRAAHLKAVAEVCTVFCATANPVRVIVASDRGERGVIGVIDGSPPKGVEAEKDRAERHAMLRRFGYKQ